MTRPWVDYRRLDSEFPTLQVHADPAAPAHADPEPEPEQEQHVEEEQDPEEEQHVEEEQDPPQEHDPDPEIQAQPMEVDEPQNNGDNGESEPIQHEEEEEEEDPGQNCDSDSEDENEERQMLRQFLYDCREQQFEDTYNDVLQSFSRKWFFTQLSHKVSAKAANEFWDTCLQFFPKLLDMKEREGRVKNVPKFIQMRRNLHAKYCPKVKMEFAFKKKNDGSITIISSTKTPLKNLQRNSDYVKLYEIASVKVIYINI